MAKVVWTIRVLLQVNLSLGANEMETMCDKLDRKAFADLLKKMLCMEADRRITPGAALKHPFVQMSGLIHCGNST